MRPLLFLLMLLLGLLLLIPTSPVASQDAPQPTFIPYDIPTTTTPKQIGTRGIAIVSAYNADPAQTDDSPCITASGYNLCERGGQVVANNCFAFGTKIEIQGVVYEVQDRMNARYDCNYLDIYMEKYEDARTWGRKHIEVTVID